MKNNFDIERKIRFLGLAAKYWELVLLYKEKKDEALTQWFENEAKKYQQWANEL